MTAYKIGEVSRVFGISNETLRYYESRGIITPRRDEESGYRYYDVWEMNYLLDSLWYRSFDFSLADVASMVYSDNLKLFDMRCRQREAELAKMIEEQQRILTCLTQYRQRLSNIEQEIGHLSIENSPEMLWQRQREQSVLEKGENATHIRQWVELFPMVKHTFLLPESNPGEGEFKDYCWGFSATPETVNTYNIALPSGAEHIPSYRSIHAVFTAGGEGTFMSAFHKQIMEPIKAAGYNPNHPPVGNLLVRTHENGEMKRYFEVWVPIQ